MFELEPKTDLTPKPETVSLLAPVLRVAEILASARRLWLRGRVLDKNTLPEKRGWFPRLWHSSPPAAPRPVHLQTRISNRELSCEVNLSPEGYFEACLAEELPPAKRGWRVARNTLTVGKEKVEGCGIVFTAPEQARQAIVVVLPLASTSRGKFETLTTCENAAWTGKILQRLIEPSHGITPVYYLGCAPLEAENRQQELALAVTALGWPAGTVVLLPGSHPAALNHGLDRLRWLFAGTLSLAVVNLENTLGNTLATRLADQTDRAEVKLLLNPGENPDTELLEQANEGTRHFWVSPLSTSLHRVTRYPLVICHGMLGLSALRMQLPDHLNYCRPLEPFLRERGFRALFPDVPPTGSVAERAAILKEQIRRWTDEPINLIAHSLGGLDCRYLISHLGMAERVRSLTTIATPHRGTYLAEWFIRNYRHRFPLLFAMEAMGVNMAAFRACLRSSCAKFNATTPDAPGVHYFSYAAEVTHAQVSPFLRRVWNILTAVEGPNDGMVSSAAMRWGECLGTIAADHFTQTPASLLANPGQRFDALGFFLHLADDLARRGF